MRVLLSGECAYTMHTHASTASSPASATRFAEAVRQARTVPLAPPPAAPPRSATSPCPPSPVPVHTPAPVSDAFKAQVAGVAARLHMRPRDLLAVMWFESRLNPAARNASTNAVGLIQFMPNVAADLLDLPMPEKPTLPTNRMATNEEMAHFIEQSRGYRAALKARQLEAVDRMQKMTPEEQLPYVEKYFQLVNHGAPVTSIRDAYMSTFWPSAIGKGGEYTIAHAGAPGFEGLVYSQNAGLDANRDGKITAGEAASLVDGAAWSPEFRNLLAEVAALGLPRPDGAA